MHPNAELINTFYRCFQARDYQGMVACYHPQIVFSDPVFVQLPGEQATAMWQMLCVNDSDLALTYSRVTADDCGGSGYWEARYHFSKTGRPVRNKITAHFEFADGKIIRHQDHFDLWRWAGMALGLQGRLAGWLPPVHQAIRREAQHLLEEFIHSAAYTPCLPSRLAISTTAQGATQ